MKKKASVYGERPLGKIDVEYTIPKLSKPKMREWESGGKRDTEVGKLDFEGFLSPLVLMRYAKYMHKHRKMKDGSYRDSDNWQKGFGSLSEHFKVCMKSLFHHFMDMWMAHRGHESRDGMEDAICGLLFNAMGYLHRILECKLENCGDIDDLKKIPGSRIGELENNAKNTM